MAGAYKTGITAEQLRSLLDYDPETGLFRWKPTLNHWRAGLPAGTLAIPKYRQNGHIVLGLGTTSERRHRWIGIRKGVYFAHRLAWLYVYGTWPDGDVDHINGDGCDNRIANLRIATTAQNAYNRTLRSDNTSGVKGVSWDKRSGKWLAHIGFNGKLHHLGLFDSQDEAKAVREEAANRLHGEFARTW